MRIKSTSLRMRFAATFAVSILVCTFTLSSIIGYVSSQQVRQEIGQNLANVTQQIVDKLDRGMWARSGEIALLSTMIELSKAQSIPAIQASLDRLQQEVPLFSWIGFTDPAGRVLAGTGGILVGRDIHERPVYREGVKGTFVGDVHEAVLLSKLLPNPSGEGMKFVDISTPVKSGDRLLGVLAAHLSWTWAQEIEQSVLRPLADRSEIQVFVVAADDTIILGPKDMIGHPLRIPSVAAARSGNGGWRDDLWDDGQLYLTGAFASTGHKTYSGLGWTVVARQPLDTAYAPVTSLQQLIVAAGLGVAVIFAVFGWLVAGRVANPLQKIAHAADHLRAGHRIAIPQHRGIAEIESLSLSLTALIASLTATEADRDKASAQALQDPLTGLANRLALDHYLQNATSSNNRRMVALTVLCMDLDGFKAVNDRLGHHAGDLLLQEIAHRLRSCARSDDFVVRLGGDEFMMILPSSHDHPDQEGHRIGERIIHAIRQPVSLDGETVFVGCSIGMACWPQNSTSLPDVIKQADDALYHSKRHGKGRVTAA